MPLRPPKYLTPNEAAEEWMIGRGSMPPWSEWSDLEFYLRNKDWHGAPEYEYNPDDPSALIQKPYEQSEVPEYFEEGPEGFETRIDPLAIQNAGFTSGYRPAGRSRFGVTNYLNPQGQFGLRPFLEKMLQPPVWQPFEQGVPELEYGPRRNYNLGIGEEVLPPELPDTSPTPLPQESPGIPQSRPYGTAAQGAALSDATGLNTDNIRAVLKRMIQERALYQRTIAPKDLPEGTREDEDNLLHALNFGAISSAEVAQGLEDAGPAHGEALMFPRDYAQIAPAELFGTQYPNRKALRSAINDNAYPIVPMQSQGYLADILNRIKAEQDLIGPPPNSRMSRYPEDPSILRNEKI